MASRSTASIRRPQPRVTPQFTTPSPTKGLNTVDPYSMMSPEFAISMTNWIASPTGLMFRQGSREWSSGLDGDVTTIIPYHSGTTVADKLFAFAGGNLYDVTSGGPVGAPLVTGLSTVPEGEYWQYVSQTFTGSGVNMMFAVNGVDYPLLYTGATWITCTQVPTPSGPGEFSTVDQNGAPVDIRAFTNVIVHQQRVWFVSGNSTKAYYLDIGTVGGVLKAFDFGALFAVGGRLHTLASWTIDNGGSASSQAQLVAISTQGDIAVYPGDDPTSASTWGPPGVYKTGAPVGDRCAARRSGDVLVLSTQGLFAMSRLVQSSRVDLAQTITYNISNLISELTTTLGGFQGFQVVDYPDRDLIVINVPQPDGDYNFQFVMNTITGGWSQFTGWPARCFAQYHNSMFFGANGKVMLAFIGYKDGADITGANGNGIVATLMTAFHHGAEGDQGVMKKVNYVKPIFQTGDVGMAIRVGVNTDYDLTQIVGTSTLNPVTGGIWDQSSWDNGAATWVGALSTFNQWVTPHCWPGEAVSLNLAVSATAETRFIQTNWVYTPGGIFG